MSTVQSIEQIQQLKQQVHTLNGEMRIANNIAMHGTPTLREMTEMVRLLTGGNPGLSALTANAETAIATLQTLRTFARLAQIELGPVGWILLGAGTLIGVTAYSYSSQVGSTVVQ